MEPLPPSETGEEWRLGAEPEIVEHGPTEVTYPPTDTSAPRLEQPVAVVTIEHLAWALIAIWTLLTRLSAIDARPLSGPEAANGLFAYDLAYRTTEAAAAGFHPTSAGWVHLLQAGIFALAGANDFTARLLYALAGMLLVAMSFEMRYYIGRAGAIGMGALLAISPTITWFSRSSAVPVMGAAGAVVTLAIFMPLSAQPSRRRAVALGIAGGLMIASGALGLLLAMTLLISLVLFGIGVSFATSNAWLRTRVWLDRYRSHTLIAISAVVVSCVLSQIVAGFPVSALRNLIAPLVTLRIPHLDSALRQALLPLGFYEFMPLLLGFTGVVIVLTMQARTRFARFTLIWLTLSVGIFLAITDREEGEVLIVLVPAAILSGIALDYLHRSPIWSYARYPIVLIAILTIYVQVATNFIHAQPDSSEAAWARHGNLYWGNDATTIQTKEQTRAVLSQIDPANRTVFNDGNWPPALRWYLRDLRSTSSNELASVVVDTTGKGNLDANRSIKFDYAESWNPVAAVLDRKSAIRFFLFQRAWGPFTTQSVATEVRNQVSAAPTLILPPPGK